jgi:mono/diheme cytochrome c family protein
MCARRLRTLFLLSLTLVFSLTLFVVPVALAGGWATVTLDSLPVEPRAGETLRLGFTIRQHGVTPTNRLGSLPLTPYLTARNQDTGERLRADAHQDGAVGHFVVEVTFPSAGTWSWKITPAPFGDVQGEFQPLLVLAPAPARAADGPPSVAWPLGVLLAAAGGLVLAFRAGILKRRQAGLAGILLVAAVPLVFWLGPSLAIQAANPARPAPASGAEYGRALFLGKGCAGCHRHAALSEPISGPAIGPSLTGYQADPDFLRGWLRDPQAIRPGSQMPDLNLSEGEIEALIAFLAH